MHARARHGVRGTHRHAHGACRDEAAHSLRLVLKRTKNVSLRARRHLLFRVESARVRRRAGRARLLLRVEERIDRGLILGCGGGLDVGLHQLRAARPAERGDRADGSVRRLWSRAVRHAARSSSSRGRGVGTHHFVGAATAQPPRARVRLGDERRCEKVERALSVDGARAELCHVVVAVVGLRGGASRAMRRLLEPQSHRLVQHGAQLGGHGRRYGQTRRVRLLRSRARRGLRDGRRRAGARAARGGEEGVRAAGRFARNTRAARACAAARARARRLAEAPCAAGRRRVSPARAERPIGAKSHRRAVARAHGRGLARRAGRGRCRDDRRARLGCAA